ncbi:helix-turn-helix domain-containing protein [Marinicella sediminis]|uniref:Helix-turn-helix domain-containing protein n=1 Tax=Marinicella sediminis TaxID=1792834 RepID=A0ABV7JBL4_9GAMM|nr:helix-turn-helix transcriptional regulator [Marinicella sediminis]
MKSSALMVPQNTLGSMLRFWRQQKNISQLQLAMDIGISTKHLSYMENDKSKPSKEMVMYLGQALCLPFRQQNRLLEAAGYAPHFKEQGLDSEEMALVNQALQQLLNNHNPFPALVMNSRYDVLLSNSGYQAFLTAVMGQRNRQQYNNALELFFASDGLRSQVKNWDLVAPMLLARVREEAISLQDDWLLNWVNAVDSPEPAKDSMGHLNYGLPMLTLEFDFNGKTGRFFTTIATIGTPLDLTTQEIRLELLYPADEFTQQLFTARGNNC